MIPIAGGRGGTPILVGMIIHLTQIILGDYGYHDRAAGNLQTGGVF
jgi:hypothetical protein